MDWKNLRRLCKENTYLASCTLLFKLGFIDDRQIAKSYQTPIEKFCEQLSVKVVFETTEMTAKSILDVKKNSEGQINPIIYLKAGLSIADKRFELARQIGNLMLNPLDNVYYGHDWYVKNSNLNLDEILAVRQFAVDILVPRITLGTYLLSVESTIFEKFFNWLRGIENRHIKNSELAELFNVPVDCICLAKTKSLRC